MRTRLVSFVHRTFDIQFGAIEAGGYFIHPLEILQGIIDP